VKFYLVIHKEIELTWMQSMNCYSDNFYLKEMPEASIEGIEAA